MLLLLVCNLLLWGVAFPDTTVTIYNEWLSQGGRVHFEVERWNKINGLTQHNLIPKCKAIRTAAGRWLNPDLSGHLFENWRQSPSHHGYPDPAYLQDHTLQSKTFGFYMQQVNGYGSDINNMVWEIKCLNWPSWIDTSHHQGKFPNNVDAAAEFVSLMVQSTKDYTGGRIPHIFEVINEPDWVEKYIDQQTNIDFHKAVAKKLKSRFGMKVGGPTYTTMALGEADENNFSYWKRTAKFLDMSLDHLDFFSFHSYNYVRVSGGSYAYSGINEARLVASIDMVENYSHLKKGKNVPLVISEFGRGNVFGVASGFENGMIDFQTIYQPNGFMFTFLNLREFIDRVIVFLLSNEQYPGHTSLRKSLFTLDGHPLHMTKFFTFWQNFYYDQRFLRISSQYDGQERIVASLALANPHNKEMVVLLHNYGSKWQNVKLDFPNNWLNPSTGEETCVLFENGNPAVHPNYHFERSKNHGTVGLPGSSTCFYKFKTNYNFNGIHTNNENTYYGKDMVIPISNGHAQTTIHLPSSGYHTAHLRVGVSRDKNAKSKPRQAVFNGHTLSSSYMLFDAMKVEGKTKWNVWEFMVPQSQVRTTNNVSMTFDGNGGHVSPVALVVGKLQ
ncbi:beta-porphyranase A-like [Haliotis rubra]|uniref:beta-porphyranase A-like n=1 Tax=Haliotis rubra TaxID=36100 RepID=UPI001EE558C8|nr:beta-porphyranase A-like [Haliotis rubra]